jgi:hypothetical protein
MATGQGQRCLVGERQETNSLGTFDDLFKCVLVARAKFKRSRQQDDDIYRVHIKGRLGGKLAADIKRSDLREALAKILCKSAWSPARARMHYIVQASLWMDHHDKS